MPTMEMMSRDEITALRARLLANVGLSHDELMCRAAEYSLTPEQSAVADEVSDLDYLLGDE